MRTKNLIIILLFTILTAFMTYPLVNNIVDSVPAGLGDPLLNNWILAWDIHKINQFDFVDFWSANIFYPQNLTLAYSEHLFASALLGLPIFLIFRNIILTYNFIFLFSFIFSGFGMYLLVKYLTNSTYGAIISGIIFAFFPYRFIHLGHLQLLTMQWIPFTFLYLHKFFEKNSWKNLSLFGLFYILQVLSCGYYALFVTVFIIFFILCFIIVSKKFLDYSLWLKLSLLMLAVIIIAGPFFYPYIQVKKEMGFSRSMWEIICYSPDIKNYLAAPWNNRLYGRFLQRFGKGGEVNLFPGIIAFCLAIVGSIKLTNRSKNKEPSIVKHKKWKRIAICILNALIMLIFFSIVILIVTGGFSFTVFGLLVSMHNLRNPFALLIGVGIIRLIIEEKLRKRISRYFSLITEGERFYLFMAVLAVLFSFGPFIHFNGREISYGPYYLLLKFIPGFSGLRVPARFNAIVMFALSVLAGFGMWKLMQYIKSQKGRVLFTVFISILILVEYISVPISMSKVKTRKDIPKVYQWLSSQSGDFPIIELPMPKGGGDEWIECEYIYYSIYHWKKLVNGYSGYFPSSYISIREAAQDFPSEDMIVSLKNLGVKYCIIHLNKIAVENRADTVEKLKVMKGIKFIGDFDNILVYEI